jgi:hypothetical protein
MSPEDKLSHDECSACGSSDPHVCNMPGGYDDERTPGGSSGLQGRFDEANKERLNLSITNRRRTA